MTLKRYSPRNLPVCEIKIRDFLAISNASGDAKHGASSWEGTSLDNARERFKDETDGKLIYMSIGDNFNAYTIVEIEELIEGLQSMVKYIKGDA